MTGAIIAGLVILAALLIVAAERRSRDHHTQTVTHPYDEIEVRLLPYEDEMAADQAAAFARGLAGLYATYLDGVRHAADEASLTPIEASALLWAWGHHTAAEAILTKEH